MRYEEFKNVFVDMIKENVGMDIAVKTDVFEKNNGRFREGLIILMRDMACPVIYLDDLYEEYKQGRVMEELLEIVISLSENNNDVQDRVQILLQGEWEEIRKSIEICVINKAWNKDKLKNLPYIEYLDLALVFRVILDNENQSSMSCLITNDLLKMWGVGKGELKEEILNRLESTCFQIKSLTEVLKERMESLEQEMCDYLIDDIESPLYVMSNTQRLYGATGIVRVDVINKFAAKVKDDLYILPSSVHELILLPVKEACSVAELRELVKSVNENEVDREEWLSDNVYFFSRERGCLEIAV